MQKFVENNDADAFLKGLSIVLIALLLVAGGSAYFSDLHAQREHEREVEAIKAGLIQEIDGWGRKKWVHPH